jgi:hypothetical protein
MSEPTETDARAHDEREIRAIVDRMFDAWGRGDVAATTPTSDATQPGTGSTAPSVGAQLLATEHWSLLVTRSTTQARSSAASPPSSCWCRPASSAWR